MNSLFIFQNNINGFYSKINLLEQNLHYKQPHICLLQEGFRSTKERPNYKFLNTYSQYWSETGRAGIFCRKDLFCTNKIFNNHSNQFDLFGYESCWIIVSCPLNSKPIIFCSFYRNLSYSNVYYDEYDYNNCDTYQNIFNLKMFEYELSEAKKISPHIVIGGDWNAHNPVWLDQNSDIVGETVLDFIVENQMHILNSLPFDFTFSKDGGYSSIDISMCSSSLLHLCSNWRTDDNELDLHSDHLPITFQIKTDWASSGTTRTKIECWNLR